jgi:hypothetical protein
MTASEQDAAAAAQAIAEGIKQALQYQEAGAAAPGVGYPVALPSVPDSLGQRPQGLNFDLPDEVPALRPPRPAPRLVPDYGPPEIGGALHQPAVAARTDRWSVSTPMPLVRASSVAYVSPRAFAPQPATWHGRIVAAIKRAFGRS